MIIKDSIRCLWSLALLFGFSSISSVSCFHLSSPLPRPRNTWSQRSAAKSSKSCVDSDSYDLCIIGGGISGLAASITAATKNDDATDKKPSIILLEAQSRPGGRVVSEYMNGYTLDVGYAVFVENYPQARKLFDYDALKLKQYEPGALIKRKQGGFARIADPLRQPSKTMGTILSPVGKLMDKVRLLPLFYYVKTTSVEKIFQDEDMDTLSCLKNKYKFSDDIIQEFFEPFLKGIYFSSLDEQSSRMFHFVFKMFVDGAASLPTGGMQAVSNQLMEKAVSVGVEIRLNHGVKNVDHNGAGTYDVMTNHGDCVRSKSVICATDYVAANGILSGIAGLDSLYRMEQQHPQRSIGCMYYTFTGDTPVKDAVLILNGEGHDSGPCLTVSFLHVVNDSYAPANGGICSVSIPSDYMEQFAGRQEELDKLVRDQLGRWWPDCFHDIQHEWNLEKMYDIKNAQPAQYFGPQPANVHGGEIRHKFREYHFHRVYMFVVITWPLQR
jgi:Flavin containing amine oxidoreductase.